MKSLKESLFDDDLVTSETGYEKFYGLVERATIGGAQGGTQYIGWLDKQKIRKDFNKLTQRYPEKDWNGPRGTWWTSMKKIHTNIEIEMLRELLYVVVSQIDTADIINSSGNVSFNLLEKNIYNVLEHYVDNNVKDNIEKYISIIPTKVGARDLDQKQYGCVWIGLHEIGINYISTSGSMMVTFKNQI